MLWRWFTDILRHAAWAPIAVFMAHLVALYMFDAYGRIPWLDMWMHVLGGVAIAFFFHRAAATASHLAIIGRLNRFGHGLLVFALTATATVFWEFYEFTADHLFDSHLQAGLTDTIKDMFLGLLGGCLILIIQLLDGMQRE